MSVSEVKAKELMITIFAPGNIEPKGIISDIDGVPDGALPTLLPPPLVPVSVLPHHFHSLV